MIQLVMLLIGAKTVRRQWALLPMIGAVWIVLGVLLIVDAASGTLTATLDMVAILLLIEGVAGFIGACAMGLRAHAALAWRAGALVLIGLLALDVLFDHGISDSLLFGMAFLVDGCVRIASAWVVRFERWRVAVFAGVVELILATLVLARWPLPHRYTIPFCLGVALFASGWSLIRLGLQLRRLPPGASITTLPLFVRRSWYSRPSVPAPNTADAHQNQEHAMTLYVWTPTGSVSEPRRQPLIDRYIAAIDHNGVISTGHSALELAPDIYISHYPGVEIDHSPTDFIHLLRAGRENDIEGRWKSSHREEVAAWCEPDAKVVFNRYDAAALRAFWDVYRRDNTYNLTSRSCSTVTSLAIESALEGIVGQRHAWLWFFLLLSDPDLWLAAILRRRGATMAWTPGLVLDYGRALRRVVERQEQRWFTRLARALTGYRGARERSEA